MDQTSNQKLHKNTNGLTEYLQTFFSKYWDFAKDNGADLIAIQGRFIWNKEKQKLILETDAAVTIELPIKFKNNYKLTLQTQFIGNLEKQKYFGFKLFSQNSVSQNFSEKDVEILTNQENDFSTNYNMRYVCYYFDEYILITLDDKKPFIFKLNHSLNESIRLKIKNLDISKMGFEKIDEADCEKVRSFLDKPVLEESQEEGYRDFKAKVDVYIQKNRSRD